MTNQAIFDRIKACLDLEPEYLQVSLEHSKYTGHRYEFINNGKYELRDQHTLETKEKWYKRFETNIESIIIWVDKETLEKANMTWSYSFDVEGTQYKRFTE